MQLETPDFRQGTGIRVPAQSLFGLAFKAVSTPCCSYVSKRQSARSTKESRQSLGNNFLYHLSPTTLPISLDSTAGANPWMLPWPLNKHTAQEGKFCLKYLTSSTKANKGQVIIIVIAGKMTDNRIKSQNVSDMYQNGTGKCICGAGLYVVS